MKTLAVRVDDETAELLEVLSRETGQKTSVLMRLALRNLLAGAAGNESMARAQAEIAARVRAAHDRELDGKLGLTPAELVVGSDDKRA